MGKKISLKLKKPKEGEIESALYPTLYLSEVKLPVNKSMIGKLMGAKVTLKFTGMRVDNSTKKDFVSYDFAVQDIEFSDSQIKETQVATKLHKVFDEKK